MISSLRFLTVLACAAAVAGPARAAPIPVWNPDSVMRAMLPDGDVTLAPFAHVKFCLEQPQDCQAGGGAMPLTLDDAGLSLLRAVNRDVNAAIRPQAKPGPAAGGHWAIDPTAGDCNDYAVSKRHALLAHGVPAGNLLLAAVVTSWGEGHLVLVVRTTGGDIVLDNLTAAVRPWSSTGYRWLKRQSIDDPHQWVSVDAPSRVGLFATRTFLRGSL